MRTWLRNLAIGAGVGLLVGLVVGGTVGRIFMRVLFLAREENTGFATAMGAIIGDFTREGTFGIYAFGAIAGTVLGLAYTAARALLPSRVRLRVVIFTLGTTAFMVGQITRANRDDFPSSPSRSACSWSSWPLRSRRLPYRSSSSASLRTGSVRPAGSRAGSSPSG